jgi:cytochrome P450
MIEAGSETTSATLNSAILHLIANPECIQSAHEELERVIPPGRGPTFEDEPNLPYIRSIVKETLRLKPVASVGSPHMTTEDIVYKDMWIPKGTVVTMFQWSIHADPTRWENPEKFMPERYLDVIRRDDCANFVLVSPEIWRLCSFPRSQKTRSLFFWRWKTHLSWSTSRRKLVIHHFGKNIMGVQN